MSQTTESSNLAGAATGRPRTPGRSRTVRGRPSGKDLLQALPWIAPALLLIIGVVLFPAGVMFFNSTRDISLSGLDKGSVGFDNFVTVFTFAEFWPILFRTVVWVVVVVGF